MCIATAGAEFSADVMQADRAVVEVVAAADDEEEESGGKDEAEGGAEEGDDDDDEEKGRSDALAVLEGDDEGVAEAVPERPPRRLTRSLETASRREFARSSATMACARWNCSDASTFFLSVCIIGSLSPCSLLRLALLLPPSLS